VGDATRAGTGLLDLPDASWDSLPGGRQLRGKLSFEASLERRNIDGGTGPASVERQLATASTLHERGRAVQAELDQGGF
jgi:argininosuccinate lyase